MRLAVAAATTAAAAAIMAAAAAAAVLLQHRNRHEESGGGDQRHQHRQRAGDRYRGHQYVHAGASFTHTPRHGPRGSRIVASSSSSPGRLRSGVRDRVCRLGVGRRQTPSLGLPRLTGRYEATPGRYPRHGRAQSWRPRRPSPDHAAIVMGPGAALGAGPRGGQAALSLAQASASGLLPRVIDFAALPGGSDRRLPTQARSRHRFCRHPVTPALVPTHDTGMCPVP